MTKMNNEPKTEMLPVVQAKEHRPVEGVVKFGHNVLTNVDIDHVLQSMAVMRELNAAKRRKDTAADTQPNMVVPPPHRELQTPTHNGSDFKNPKTGKFDKAAYLDYHRRIQNN